MWNSWSSGLYWQVVLFNSLQIAVVHLFYFFFYFWLDNNIIYYCRFSWCLPLFSSSTCWMPVKWICSVKKKTTVSWWKQMFEISTYLPCVCFIKLRQATQLCNSNKWKLLQNPTSFVKTLRNLNQLRWVFRTSLWIKVALNEEVRWVLQEVN